MSCRLVIAFLFVSLLAAGCSVGTVKAPVDKVSIDVKVTEKDLADVLKDKGIPGGIQIKDAGDKVVKGTPGPLEQSGEFRAWHDSAADVSFPLPYAKTPEITLKSKLGPHNIEIIDVRTTGFTYKNNGKRDFLDDSDILFTAKGIPAAGNPEKPDVQTGDFKAEAGKTGEVKFAAAFANPPYMEIVQKGPGLLQVRITEITKDGFKWKNNGKDNFLHTHDVTYTAKGKK